ncbi:MAG TPA: hypothetical protein VFM66_10620, partial [Agromyces sp.]|nr:hypothetical protein [Agromyces sp.]
GVVFSGAVGASAHTGPYKLEITPDGAGGISVIGHYVEDGHTVDAILDPIATATTEDGRKAGPVELISSAEGEGVWVTEEPFLEAGTWTVTVETTTPLSVTASTQFEVAPLDPPIEGAAASAADAAAPAVPIWPWLAGGAALVAAGAAGVVVWWRTRSGGAAVG